MSYLFDNLDFRLAATGKPPHPGPTSSGVSGTHNFEFTLATQNVTSLSGYIDVLDTLSFDACFVQETTIPK
eukprot:2280140-Karenia_brevis.AAC.1